MLTIPNAVEEVIKKKPFLEGALVEGLINLSALARQLKPEIEKKVGKEVNDSAVIMALNRLVPRLELMSAMKFKKVVENIGDIIVRSNLADYAFLNSSTLYEKQAILLDRVRSMKDVFCTFSQGIYETDPGGQQQYDSAGRRNFRPGTKHRQNHRSLLHHR